MSSRAFQAFLDCFEFLTQCLLLFRGVLVWYVQLSAMFWSWHSNTFFLTVLTCSYQKKKKSRHDFERRGHAKSLISPLEVEEWWCEAAMYVELLHQLQMSWCPCEDSAAPDFSPWAQNGLSDRPLRRPLGGPNHTSL